MLPKGTKVSRYKNGNTGYEAPCFTHIETIADEANAAHVSWRYYSAPRGRVGYIWSTLDEIKHIRDSKQWATNVIPTTDFIHNVSSGNLAKVRRSFPLRTVRPRAREHVRGRELDRRSARHDYALQVPAEFRDRIDVGQLRWLL